jgi:hypothetical protein
MHTTLELLKQTKACVPGYTRMISFFTTDAGFKKMPIPLWAIGLIGEWDDVEWATDNALIIDPVAFEVLRQYTFLSVFKDMFWERYTDNHDGRSKNPIINQMVEDSIKARSNEDVQSVLDKYRKYHFEDRMWTQMLENAVWYCPHEYIKFVYQNMGNTIHYAHRQRYRRRRVDFKDAYYYPYVKGESKAYNFARLCCGGRDPYPVMLELMAHTKLGSKKGFQLTSIQEGGATKYAATLHFSAPRQIFHAYHLLMGGELKINEITNVNATANAIAQAVGSIGTLESLDEDSINNLVKQANPTDNEGLAAAAKLDGEMLATASDDEDKKPTSTLRKAVSIRRRIALTEDTDDTDDTAETVEDEM